MKTLNPSLSTRLIRLHLLLIGMMFLLTPQVIGQSQLKNSLRQMVDDDRTTIEVIAGCDVKLHPHILLLCESPELLTKIEELQQRSQNQFKSIIERYDRDAQAAFYEMARYPSLISELVATGRPSNSDVEQIIAKYPQDIRAITKKNAVAYYEVLLQIERLNTEIDRAFKYALEQYPTQIAESVNMLLGYPEVISALVEDKPFTKLLGEVYHEDPQWVIGQITEVAQQLATQNKADLDAYKDQIQKDPQAYNEMLDASDKFSRENNEVRYLENSSDPIIETRVVNCYPYWFGYPYWYADPYWRPRPLYYHTGIYRNNAGSVFIVGLPSGFFLNWHSAYHPKLYPHLSYHYYNFYENHYMKRFRESPHTFPHYGFYRSIEKNVINNPRVNNRSLHKIDRQHGTNIVHRPNLRESQGRRSGATDLNSSRRRSEPVDGVSRNRTVAPRNLERPNVNPSGRTYNQREINSVSPRRSEGNVNRSNSESGTKAIRRDVRTNSDQPTIRRAPEAKKSEVIKESNNNSRQQNRAKAANENTKEKPSGKKEERKTRTKNKD
jgi:hypothetical protein